MRFETLVCALGAATAAVEAARSGLKEPHNFNATQALLDQGIDLNAYAGDTLPNGKDSRYPTCIFACHVLEGLFETVTFKKGTKTYETFRASYWSLQQAEVEPQCVFEPENPHDLATGILVSRAVQCSFAAKSGGHAAFASASSIEDGIAISLARLDQINVSADLRSVDVGPGNKWQAVYEKVEKQGIVVIGGRDGDIGVGGLVTGGGVSLFSSEHGWACDNVLSYEVVTAWGSVIEANESENGDLYWALRGGGNNFGLVTNFKLVAFEMGDVWGGAIGWPEASFPALISAYYNLAVNSPSDPKAASILSFAGGTPLGNIAQALVSYSSPIEVPAILEELVTVPEQIFNSTSVRSPSNYSSNFASWPNGTRDDIWTHTSFMTIEFMTFLVDTFLDIGPRLQAIVPDLKVSTSFQTITQGMLNHMQKRGGNALGLVQHDGPLLLISQAWIWSDASMDKTVLGGMREFQTKVEAKAVELGVDAGYRYMNYANIYQDVIASYGSESKQRLQRVAGNMDPSGVWQRLQPGYFKLNFAPINNIGTSA